MSQVVDKPLGESLLLARQQFLKNRPPVNNPPTSDPPSDVDCKSIPSEPPQLPKRVDVSEPAKPRIAASARKRDMSPDSVLERLNSSRKLIEVRKEIEDGERPSLTESNMRRHDASYTSGHPQPTKPERESIRPQTPPVKDVDTRSNEGWRESQLKGGGKRPRNRESNTSHREPIYPERRRPPSPRIRRHSLSSSSSEAVQFIPRCKGRKGKGREDERNKGGNGYDERGKGDRHTS